MRKLVTCMIWTCCSPCSYYNFHIPGEVGAERNLRLAYLNLKMSWCMMVHSKLRSITPVATKVHIILRSFVVLTWMRDTIELV